MNKQYLKYITIFVLSIIINYCVLKKVLNLSIIHVVVISTVICLITLIIDYLVNNKVIEFFQQSNSTQKDTQDRINERLKLDKQLNMDEHIEKHSASPADPSPPHTTVSNDPCSIDIIKSYDKDHKSFDHSCNLELGRKFWDVSKTTRVDDHKDDVHKPQVHKDHHKEQVHTPQVHKDHHKAEDKHKYDICSRDITKSMLDKNSHEIEKLEHTNKCLFAPHHYEDLYKKYRNPYNIMNWDSVIKNLHTPINITDDRMDKKITTIDTLINEIKESEKNEDQYIKKIKSEINKVQDKNKNNNTNKQSNKKKNNICSYINLSDSYTPLDQFNYKILNN